ncbi:uncharacterized protein PFL1_06278 [Pseudozyma flocculosa PF-1]|uniref:Secreted protein n=2 Tax=Pseudozyma flocculosa TaxID=84751 RepID=A0A5C3F753_9BASI|nr:uncharacterized protein PFL1_06278 [Pseudozyma flocculosa PF-1]EPQ26070.1 hypothetical protein PFL1_06278 [Pseudozyma flocculosa PF-1]SPO40313.1 uncharacterized protein PSFLO_05795 [Pseudozyma flocculosa]
MSRLVPLFVAYLSLSLSSIAAVAVGPNKPPTQDTTLSSPNSNNPTTKAKATARDPTQPGLFDPTSRGVSSRNCTYTAPRGFLVDRAEYTLGSDIFYSSGWHASMLFDQSAQNGQRSEPFVTVYNPTARGSGAPEWKREVNIDLHPPLTAAYAKAGIVSTTVTDLRTSPQIYFDATARHLEVGTRLGGSDVPAARYRSARPSDADLHLDTFAFYSGCIGDHANQNDCGWSWKDLSFTLDKPLPSAQQHTQVFTCTSADQGTVVHTAKVDGEQVVFAA